MSEKIKPKETKVSILPIIGGALIGLVKNNCEPKIIKIPKEIKWEQKRTMKRMPRSGKK